MATSDLRTDPETGEVFYLIRGADGLLYRSDRSTPYAPRVGIDYQPNTDPNAPFRPKDPGAASIYDNMPPDKRESYGKSWQKTLDYVSGQMIGEITNQGLLGAESVLDNPRYQPVLSERPELANTVRGLLDTAESTYQNFLNAPATQQDWESVVYQQEYPVGKSIDSVYRDPTTGYGIIGLRDANGLVERGIVDPKGRYLRGGLYTAKDIVDATSNNDFKKAITETFRAQGIVPGGTNDNFWSFQPYKSSEGAEVLPSQYGSPQPTTTLEPIQETAFYQGVQNPLSVIQEPAQELTNIYEDVRTKVGTFVGEPGVAGFTPQTPNVSLPPLSDFGGAAVQLQAPTQTQQSPRTQSILASLPSDWNTYTPANKRFWFESNGVTRTDLEAAGVPQADINALYAQTAVEKKGSTGTTNVTNQTATNLLNKNISIADASAVFQSLFGRAPTQQELANFASVAANDPRLASRSAFEAYLRGTPDYLALQQQTQQQQNQGLTSITQQQAIDTFQSIFGRVPNSTELANFLAYQRGSTPFTSTDALAAYLRSTPDFAAYQARKALQPMTYGRAVVPQSQLQYGYGPEQGLLTNIKGPTGQQIQNQMDAFYAASYGGTPTAGLLAPAIAQMANQQQPPNFYAMPTGAPSMQELTQRAQGLLDQGYTMADLRSQAMQNNLSPQVTGAILSNVQQGGSTPYLQGLLSGELPLVAGQNLLAAR